MHTADMSGLKYVQTLGMTDLNLSTRRWDPGTSIQRRHDTPGGHAYAWTWNQCECTSPTLSSRSQVVQIHCSPRGRWAWFGPSGRGLLALHVTRTDTRRTLSTKGVSTACYARLTGMNHANSPALARGTLFAFN